MSRQCFDEFMRQVHAVKRGLNEKFTKDRSCLKEMIDAMDQQVQRGIFSLSTLAPWIAKARSDPQRRGVKYEQALRYVEQNWPQLEYKGPNEAGFTILDHRLYVIKGTRVTIRLRGTASQQPVEFTTVSTSDSEAGELTFQVQFGNVNVTFKAIVYEINPKLTFEDEFMGRSKNNVGVDERLTLGFETVPAGISLANIGGVRWEIRGSAGNQNRKEYGLIQKSKVDTAAPDNSGSAYYIAPFTTGVSGNKYFLLRENKDITLRAVIINGPCKNYAFEKTIKVWSPQAHMVVATGSDAHDAGYPTAGFLGLIHFHPTNVSFSTLEFSESNGIAVAKGLRTGTGNGYFKRVHNQRHWPTGLSQDVIEHGLPRNRAPASISNGDCQKGCCVIGQDSVYSGGSDYGGVFPRPVVPAPVVPAPALSRQQVPAVLRRVPNAPYMAPQMNLGKGGPVEMVEPSEYTWEIDWQYRVKSISNPVPKQNQWIVFQIVVHKAEVDGQGTVRMSKGSPGQRWPIAELTKRLADPPKSFPAVGNWPPLTCLDVGP